VNQDRQSSRWRLTRRHVAWAAGFVVALVGIAIVVLGYFREWTWTGLVKDDYPKRTLWDWLDLLIVPAVLAIGGYLFNRSENRATQAAAERRAQDEALQAYLDNMSDMLITNKDQPSLYDEHPPDSLRTVARARTLTVLARLDGDRKARVVQFLYESDLISTFRPILDLSGADLSGVVLRRAILDGVNLQKADFRGANLDFADLREAKLHKADLSGAHVRGTVLHNADLSSAQFEFADLSPARRLWSHDPPAGVSPYMHHATTLSGARLESASLAYANLSHANLVRADLSHANLSDVTGVTQEQLEEQPLTLEGATMPDGSEHP
jgi:uncharacterized protein YjbI with pentapeptide repeats